jgi:hypothetical protein
MDGEQSQHLRTGWKEIVDPDSWDKVVDVAARILMQCPNPQGPARQVTGLALGKVQSGKTLSYTALIALAIDNRYRITVVLAGTKIPLMKQNYHRLYHDLAEERPIVTPFENPILAEADVIRSVLQGGGHALIVVLKNRTRIDNVTQVLGAPELRGYPTLIIDDEGDEASLNTQFRRGAQSAVYASIQRLRGVLGRHAYIAYTATPQAPLLIDGIDGLSPNFAVLVNPGHDYCGGSVFFGDNIGQFVRILPDEEAQQRTEIPESLRRGIATFLVGACILHHRTPNERHSMLVHTSNRKADHEQLQSTIKNLIELWRNTLTVSDSDPARVDIIQLFRDAYIDLCTTVEHPPSWENVSNLLRGEIWQVEVWMVNSLPQSRDPMGTPFRLRNNIIVGGNMLSRGLTIQGLAVTYITRRAQIETNADTMEQRARWFGYKRPYLDLCRIFVTAQLRDDYTTLLVHEDDFWEALQRNQNQGLSVRDWRRMFLLDMEMGLRPTRSSVANVRQFRGGGWDVQTRLIWESAVASQNVQAAREFFQNHSAVPRLYGNIRHLVVADCPTEAVISDLLAKLQTNDPDWDNSYTEEYLARLLLAGILPSMDVLFMAEGKPRGRSPRSGGSVQIMEGGSNTYPGDRGIAGGRVMLQVHIIYDLEDAGKPQSTALALYIPDNDPRFNLRYVVRGVTDAGN